MAELAIAVIGARPEPYAAVPTIMFEIALRETTGAPVHAVVLRSQIRIEPQRRRYGADEEVRLGELFGATSQWAESLQPFQWAHVDTTVSGFRGETVARVPMVCTYDFEVSGTKYLHALDDGEIPLLFLFSGTVFSDPASGPTPTGFSVERVPWHLESRFRMPVEVWRQTMDHYFPGAGWLRLDRETIDRLARYRTARALPTWEQAIEQLLKSAGEDDA